MTAYQQSSSVSRMTPYSATWKKSIKQNLFTRTIVVTIFLFLFSCSEMPRPIYFNADWKWAANDHPSFSLSDYDDSTWTTVRPPVKISGYEGSPIWLRGEFRAADIRRNFAIYPDNSGSRIYLNGRQLIEKDNDMVIVPAEALQPGINSVAIRYIVPPSSGIVEIPDGLYPVSGMYAYIHGHFILYGTATAFFFFLFLTTFLLAVKVSSRDIMAFSILSMNLALIALARMLEINDILFIALLPSTILFLTHRLADLAMHQYLFIHPLLHLIVAIIAIFSDLAEILFLALTYGNIAFLLYFIMVILQKALKKNYIYIPSPEGPIKMPDFRKRKRGAGFLYIPTTIGPLWLTLSLIRPFIDGASPFTHDTAISGFWAFFIFGGIMNMLRFNLKRIELKQRSLRLKKNLKQNDQVFLHIHSTVSRPARLLLKALEAEPAQKENKKSTDKDKKTEKSIGEILEDIEESLASVKELGSVETKYVKNIRLLDAARLLEQTAPESLSVSLQLANTVIRTDAELFSELMHRIEKFPAFSGFTHRDMIAITDDHYNVHLRFLFFDRDIRQTLKAYNGITSPEDEKYSLLWASIQDMIQKLSGSMKTRLLSKKYISIDISFPGFPDPDSEKPETREQLNFPDINSRTELPATSQKRANSAIQDPKIKFRADMTVSEFIAWLKSKK